MEHKVEYNQHMYVITKWHCDIERDADWQGYRTGHVYRDSVTSQRYGRSISEADIAQKNATPLPYVCLLIFPVFRLHRSTM